MPKNQSQSSALALMLLLAAQPALAGVTPATQQVIVWHAGSLNNAFKAPETVLHM
jgi:ABC-type molybdate transport system substrate-binding protein